MGDLVGFLVGNFVGAVGAAVGSSVGVIGTLSTFFLFSFSSLAASPTARSKTGKLPKRESDFGFLPSNVSVSDGVPPRLLIDRSASRSVFIHNDAKISTSGPTTRKADRALRSLVDVASKRGAMV